MGVHTSIYRERNVRRGSEKGYELKLFRGGKEIKLYDPLTIREEFYFGKSVWAINGWFYQWKLAECKKWKEEPDEDLSYEWIDEESILLEDLKRLLAAVEEVLKNPERADEILPWPKEFKCALARKGCYDEKEDSYTTSSDEERKDVSVEEMYDEYYYSDLKYAKKLLEQLIREDGQDLICDYIVSVG